jgi:predicted RNA-binding protein with PUA-like domain
VGVAKVVKESYQDPTTEDTNWVVVNLKPHLKLKKPVSLVTLKSDEVTSTLAFIRQGRLSVSPVTAPEFDRIMELAQIK